MFLMFAVPASEFDSSEMGPDDIWHQTSEIWGEQVVVYAPVLDVTMADSTIITFPDGSAIQDPSWETWGVVQVVPDHARNEHERRTGRIRTLTEG